MSEGRANSSSVEIQFAVGAELLALRLEPGRRYEITAGCVASADTNQSLPIATVDSGKIIDLVGDHLETLFRSASSELSSARGSQSERSVPLLSGAGLELRSLRGARPFLAITAFGARDGAVSEKSLAVVSGIGPSLRSLILGSISNTDAKTTAICPTCELPMFAANLQSRISELAASHSTGVLVLLYSRKDPEQSRGHMRQEVALLEFLELTEQQYLAVNSELVEVSTLRDRFSELADTPIDCLDGTQHVVQFVAGITQLPITTERTATLHASWDGLSPTDRPGASLAYLADRRAKFSESLQVEDCMRCPQCSASAPLLEDLPGADSPSALSCQNCRAVGIVNDKHGWMQACPACLGSALGQSWRAWRWHSVAISSLADFTFAQLEDLVSGQHPALVSQLRILIEAGFGEHKLWHPFAALSPNERIHLAMAQCRQFSIAGTLIAVRGANPEDPVVERVGWKLLEMGNIVVLDRVLAKVEPASEDLDLQVRELVQGDNELFVLRPAMFSVEQSIQIHAGRCHFLSGGPVCCKSTILRLLAEAVRAKHAGRVFNRVVRVALLPLPNNDSSFAQHLLGALILAELSRLPEARRRGRTDLAPEVLELLIDRAADYFADSPVICAVLEALCAVGLGDVRLGAKWSTLPSSQQIISQLVVRIAEPIASEALKRSHKRIIFTLDEPFRGVEKRDAEATMVFFRQIVRKQGHAVVVASAIAIIKSRCQ